MHNTGLLLLTGHFRLTIDTIGQYLKSIHKNVSKRLYIKLEPDLNRPLLKSDHVHLNLLSASLPLVYSEASSVLKHIDVRVLLNSLKYSKPGLAHSVNVDIVFTNCRDDEKTIKSYILSNFNLDCNNIIMLDSKNFKQNIEHIDELHSEYKTFKTVCLGGTFDRLHNGHKVLLSECALRATEKIIVGVSDGIMVQKKVLSEFIEPIEKRMQDVTEFLSAIDPSLEYDVVKLYDPFGPTITNPDVDCLVVTTETKAGGEKVNIERKKRGMNEVFLHILDVVENTEHLQAEDEKLSSSTQRMRLLGTPIKTKTDLCGLNQPFIILLRGHFLSDKGIVAQRFQDSGIPVLCCDNITKAVLEKDDFKISLPEEFAKFFSDDNPTFDCIQLTCLKNQDFRKWLSEKYLDKIKASLQQVMNIYLEQGVHTLMIKDSTLFENCELGVNHTEVWSAILPPTVVLQKLKSTYKVDDIEASNLSKCFPSNEQYLKMSNVLFSNLWSLEYTQTQIDRALEYIKCVKQKKSAY